MGSPMLTGYFHVGGGQQKHWQNIACGSAGVKYIHWRSMLYCSELHVPYLVCFSALDVWTFFFAKEITFTILKNISSLWNQCSEINDKKYK